MHPLVVVTATVLLGLVSAVLLKEASSQQNMSQLIMALIFFAVLFVNSLRFVLWGHVHKRHPISLSYPLGSLFFPMILLVGYFYYGEPVTVQKLVASVIIMLGVGILTIEEK
jgi:multidrug transporter EmrE-like cation transporter